MLFKQSNFGYSLPMLTKIGKRIRELRERHGWSQETLGDKAGGINKDTINRIEQGANTTLASLDAIAKALGVPFGGLVPMDERELVPGSEYLHLPERHRIVHRHLQEILDFGPDAEFLIRVNVESILRRCRAGDLHRSLPDEDKNH